VCGIVKSNFHFKTDHSSPGGEQTYSFTVSLTSVLDGRGLSHFPAGFNRKNKPAPIVAGWIPWLIRTGAETLAHMGIRSPDRLDLS